MHSKFRDVGSAKTISRCESFVGILHGVNHGCYRRRQIALRFVWIVTSVLDRNVHQGSSCGCAVVSSGCRTCPLGTYFRYTVICLLNTWCIRTCRCVERRLTSKTQFLTWICTRVFYATVAGEERPRASTDASLLRHGYAKGNPISCWERHISTNTNCVFVVPMSAAIR